MIKFEINDRTVEQINEWQDEHRPKCRLYDKKLNEIYVGAIGGHLTYCITPNSLGVTVKVKCACGEEINVTDYEEW